MREDNHMNNGSITVVGLGPGRAGLITRESWELMAGAEHLLLRTEVHPSVEAIRQAGIAYQSYDGLYEKAGGFEALYHSIVDDLLKRLASGERIVYAVPGSPFVAERTVILLRERMSSEKDRLDIFPGMSFVEALYSSLGIDPIAGLAILDAETIEEMTVPTDLPLVLTQVYNQRVASEAKLFLMEHYTDEYEIQYLHHLSLDDEEVRSIPLFELDRQPDIDHLTCVFIPRKGNV